MTRRALPLLAAVMNQPRRILHLISRLDGYGGARMLRYLAASQASAGLQVVVAAMRAADGIADELRGQGVTVEVLGSRWQADPIAMIRAVRLQRTFAADLVLAWDAHSVLAATLAGRVPTRMLVAALDANQVANRWAVRTLGAVHNKVDAFVAQDVPTRAWLQRLGVSEQRIQLIRPGVWPSLTPARDRTEWLGRFDLPSDAKVIAVAGPLVRRKRFDEAIWAYELVRVIHPNARLIVLGDGSDHARLERFADDVSEPECVKFLGYRSDIAEILPNVDLFWQLNDSLTTPWTLLEALAAGVPVVASDVPAHRTVIVPNETGLLVPLDNRAEIARATDELLNYPERAKQLGVTGAKIVNVHWCIATANHLHARLCTQRI